MRPWRVVWIRLIQREAVLVLRLVHIQSTAVHAKTGDLYRQELLSKAVAVER